MIERECPQCGKPYRTSEKKQTFCSYQCYWASRTIHGHSRKSGRSRTYNIWASMIKRCVNPRHKAYHRYGGRGITVDPSWMDFTAFLADMGEAPADMTIDRQDNSGNYTKANCRWITNAQQQHNKRTTRYVTVCGRTVSLTEACREHGLSTNAVFDRMRYAKEPPIIAFLHCYESVHLLGTMRGV